MKTKRLAFVFIFLISIFGLEAFAMNSEDMMRLDLGLLTGEKIVTLEEALYFSEKSTCGLDLDQLLLHYEAMCEGREGFTSETICNALPLLIAEYIKAVHLYHDEEKIFLNKETLLESIHTTEVKILSLVPSLCIEQIKMIPWDKSIERKFKRPKIRFADNIEITKKDSSQMSVVTNNNNNNKPLQKKESKMFISISIDGLEPANDLKDGVYEIEVNEKESIILIITTSESSEEEIEYQGPSIIECLDPTSLWGMNLCVLKQRWDALTEPKIKNEDLSSLVFLIQNLNQQIFTEEEKLVDLYVELNTIREEKKNQSYFDKKYFEKKEASKKKKKTCQENIAEGLRRIKQMKLSLDDTMKKVLRLIREQGEPGKFFTDKHLDHLPKK